MAISVKAPLFWSSLSSLGVQFVSFAAFAVLARTLGVETFGLVALAATIVDLLLIVSAIGIADAVVQRAALDEDEAATAFWAGLGLGLFFFLLSFALAGAIADFYQRPDLAPVMRALSFVFLLTPLGATHVAMMTRAMNFRAIALRNLLANLTGAVVGIAMAVAGFGAWALVGQRLTLAAMLAVLAWTVAKWIPRLAFRPAAFMSFVRFGGFLSMSQLFVTLNSRLAELLSGVFFGPGVVAFVRAGGRVMDALNQLTLAPFNQIAMPLQARVQHDPASRTAIYVKLSRASALLMFPSFLGVFALAPPIVSVVFGSAWGPAADAIRILALAVFPFQLNVLLIAALTAAGRSRMVMGWSMAQAALGIAMVTAASPWGWEAMLAANVARAYLFIPVALAIQSRALGITVGLTLRSIRPAAVSAIVMAAVVAGLAHATQGLLSPLAQMMALTPVGVVLFLGLYLPQDPSGLVMLRDAWRGRRSSSGTK